MPGLSGIEATRKIHSEKPDIRIIGLSMHAAKRYVQEMYKAGARGYLLKDCDFDELIDAIHTVAAGGTYFVGEFAGVAAGLTRPRQLDDETRIGRSGGSTSLFSSFRGTGDPCQFSLEYTRIPVYTMRICNGVAPRGRRHRVGTAPHQSRDEENACAGQLHTRRRGQLSSWPPALSSG